MTWIITDYFYKLKVARENRVAIDKRADLSDEIIRKRTKINSRSVENWKLFFDIRCLDTFRADSYASAKKKHKRKKIINFI